MTPRSDQMCPEVADPAWVDGLLDTMAEGDVDEAAEVLEGLARRLRKAGKAKRALRQVPTASITAAFALRATRNEATSCS